METRKIFGAAIVMLIILVGLDSCKSKQKTVSNKNEVGKIIEELPCENAGRSDKKHFRASGMGESSDLSLAKEKALIDAKRKLVTLINSTTKTVTDRYVNEREFGDASEFESKFENLTREVADETINNLVITCEKASVLDNGKYRGFTAIEVSKEDINNGFDSKLSNNAKLQVDYDKQKFEEIFNEEMEKMAAERGY